MSSSASLVDAEDPAAAANLSKMKAGATALLIFAAAVYVVLQIVDLEGTLWGYVEAAAEAAMVGGLADWFAVTALFRHPLGLPIPHTAIIPKRKNEIGRTLGTFVQDNFLQSEILAERLTQAGIGGRLADWMIDPANANAAGRQLGAIVSGLTEVLQDDEVQAGIEAALTAKLDELDVAPLAGKAVDFVVDGGHHEVILNASLSGVAKVLEDNRLILRHRLTTESPWWVPEPIDDKVFDRLYTGMSSFLSDLAGQPQHQLRQNLEIRAQDLADQLKSSPDMAARAEQVKAEFLSHPEVREWIADLWGNIKTAVVDAANDPESELRVRFEEVLISGGHRLKSDPELQTKVDGWVAGAVTYVADQSKDEVADLIATTVEKWDPEDTSRRIELQVGKDLQFIRINGTVVGGVAGLAIHAVSQFLG